MHRLEITGNTPEELYFNCIKTLSIMLKGSTAMAEPVAEAQVVENIVVAETSAETVVEQVIAEEAPPAGNKRGRRPKAEKAADADLNDAVPDLGGAPAEPAKELTLDGDIKPRLQAIAAACTKRGMSMPATVAYCQKLYAPFGIAKAPQLKPEQFEEFMEASEGYLDGTAEA
jgi:hypothetical protein